MLKTTAQTPQEFFDLCLTEIGFVHDEPLLVTDLKALQPRPPFAAPQTSAANTPPRTLMLGRLHEARDSADAVWKRGQPELSESDARKLGPAEWQAWNKHWAAWAGARRPAFFARAALALLGDRAALDYLLDQMRASDNLVFQISALDAVQHATGRYLSDDEVDAAELERGKLADWWRLWLAENAT